MLHGYIHPDFARIAPVLAKQLPKTGEGGAALTVYHRGRCVVDLWGGTRDKAGNPWQADTVSLSFSTTKGIVSTLLHILVDQGYADYDDAISKFWPEFGGNGKRHITLRQLMCHEAGLYRIRDMVDHADRMMDWDYMIRSLEQAAPAHAPGAKHGYHALTYGFLVGEVVSRITGKSVSEVLHELLVEPLALDGMYIGMPETELNRRAQLITNNGRVGRRGPAPRLDKTIYKAAMRGLKMAASNIEHTLAALNPSGMVDVDFNHPDLLKSTIPSANGMFSARSLAKVYATLANGGELEGAKLLSPKTIARANQVQNRRIGKVIPVPMHWRLGYHRVFTMGHSVPFGFGHFGFGGSGAWADPERNLSVGLVLNSGVGTPFGDIRIVNINSVILRIVDQLEGRTVPDKPTVTNWGAAFMQPSRANQEEVNIDHWVHKNHADEMERSKGSFVG